MIGSGPGVDLGVGLDGATISLEPVASVVALPGVGPGASLVDLTLAERSQSGPMIDTTKQVWLAAGASPADRAPTRRPGHRAAVGRDRGRAG